MRYVYLIKSVSHPEQKSVGSTGDLRQRLEEHNAGKSPHTSKFTPWRLVAAIKFEDDVKARDFEKYLKSGSGRAFANKHLW